MLHKETHGPAVQVILQRCVNKCIYSSCIHRGPWEGAEVTHMNHLERVPDCE